MICGIFDRGNKILILKIPNVLTLFFLFFLNNFCKCHSRIKIDLRWNCLMIIYGITTLVVINKESVVGTLMDMKYSQSPNWYFLNRLNSNWVDRYCRLLKEKVNCYRGRGISSHHIIRWIRHEMSLLTTLKPKTYLLVIWKNNIVSYKFIYIFFTFCLKKYISVIDYILK